MLNFTVGDSLQGWLQKTIDLKNISEYEKSVTNFLGRDLQENLDCSQNVSWPEAELNRNKNFAKSDFLESFKKREKFLLNFSLKFIIFSKSSSAEEIYSKS